MTSSDNAAALEQVGALFRQSYGSEPGGVWEAPGRVNLIGEHTDYNDGLVLPIAIGHRTFCAASRRDDQVLRLISGVGSTVVETTLDQVAPGAPDGWARYAAGVIWALADAGHTVGGMDIAITSTVPVGAGLSSSAALEAAVGAAASDLYGLGLLADDAGRNTLAQICRHAENHIAQAPTGGMDQAAALRSRAGDAMMLDCRSWEAQFVEFAPSAHDLTLLVIDTGVKHSLADGKYGKRRTECEEAARILGVKSLRDVKWGEKAADELEHLNDSPILFKRALHVVSEIERVRDAFTALQAGDYAELGTLMTASHLSLRDDFEVSSPELNAAVDGALDAGAVGARMTGGGFGGSAIALVATSRLDVTRSSINEAFAANGFAAPTFLVVEPSGGASRVS